MFLFIHHISALLVLFTSALFDDELKKEMREELVSSSDVFSHAVSYGHRLAVRGAAKGLCIVAELLRVRLPSVTR